MINHMSKNNEVETDRPQSKSLNNLNAHDQTNQSLFKENEPIIDKRQVNYPEKHTTSTVSNHPCLQSLST